MHFTVNWWTPLAMRGIRLGGAEYILISENSPKLKLFKKQVLPN